MSLAYYSVHDYSLDDDMVYYHVNLLDLFHHQVVVTEWMLDTVMNLNVGDEQLSDREALFIRRIK